MNIMKEEDKKNRLTTLRINLREALLQEKEGEQFNNLFNKCCKSLFVNDFYLIIWDEDILLQLDQLFHNIAPDPVIHGQKLKKIDERRVLVHQINDLFFSILSREYSIEDVCKKLTDLVESDDSLLLKLKASNRLEELRSSNASASEKLESFIEHLVADNGVDFNNLANAIKCVMDSLKNKEKARGVNTLLVSGTYDAGVVVPLQVRIRNGAGEIKSMVSESEYFRKAIERAKSAVEEIKILSNTDNVEYSLEITDANYVGASIALPAAIAMWSAKSKMPIDPYTAFTGDINLEGDQLKIKRVKGISRKLDAAIVSGIRRVYIPKDNSADVTEDHEKELQVHLVEDVTELLLNLQKSIEPLPGNSLHVRKINRLRAYCLDQGWHISDPQPIQDGLQFTIAPVDPPELKVNLYFTGSHTPKRNDASRFQELLANLAELDQSQIPIQPIKQPRFNIKDSELQYLIQKSLEQLGPSEIKSEKYCKYSYVFENGNEKIFIKQFEKGKLLLQGRGGELYKKILEIIVGLYNSKYPTAKLEVGNYAKYKQKTETSIDKDIQSPSLREVPFPHIGTDESGKGDYFGPMVIAGVWLEESTKNRIEMIGVRDSKLMSNKRCKELASQIREICHGKYEVVEITPAKYNELYDEFKKEGKNLNHLLAWGHARAIESLLTKHTCKYAIADQFGDKKFIESKLMEKGKKIDLIQITKGERYLAVAAASILARDRFLTRMENFSQEYGTELPKGASDAVIEAAKLIVGNKGQEELKKVAKLHHKTTGKVLVGD